MAQESNFEGKSIRAGNVFFISLIIFLAFISCERNSLYNTAKNKTLYGNTVATPAFSIPGGLYRGNRSVMISTSTSEASIIYTTDGSTPGHESGALTGSTQIFTAPLSLSVNTTVKAMGIKEGMEDSRTAAADYKFCPAGYIPVPANSKVGTMNDFCVAQFEMKNAGGAVSDAVGNPWINIDQNQAGTECQNRGPGFHLITNAEWMTIAQNIESVSSNWDSGIAGTGILNIGHCDNDPAWACDASVENVTVNCTTSAGAGWDLQKRTHTLSNGEIIWDLGGNVWEWVDWVVAHGDKAFSSGDGATVVAFREWTSIDMNIGSGQIMDVITWQPVDTGLNSANGIGQYYSGTNDPGAALRGGNFSSVVNTAGIFSLSLGELPTAIGPLYGFRCACDP